MSQDSYDLSELAQLELTDPRGEAIMQELKARLAPHFNVVLVGPYLSLSWRRGIHLVSAHFVVGSITDSSQLEPPDMEEIE